MMRANPFLSLTLLLALAACSSWMGEKEKPPLEGKREPVLMAPVADARSEAKNADAATAMALPEAATNAVWSQPYGYPTHNPGHLALSGDLSKRGWSASIGKGIDREDPVMPAPIVVENTAYAVDTDGQVSAFDIASGKRQWKTSTRAKKQAKDELSAGGGLAYGRGLLVVTNGSRDVVALNAQTGAEAWRATLTAPMRGAPAVLAGRVYLTDAGNHVIALDAANGAKLWSWDGIPEDIALLGTPAPAVDDNSVIAALSSGQIVSLSLADGQPVWDERFNTMAGTSTDLTDLRDIAGVPVIDQGRAYGVSAGGRMMAIDIANGTRLWQKDVRGTGSVWAAGDVLYLSTREGVSARLAADGSSLWDAGLPQYKDAEDKEKPIHWFGPYLLGGKLYSFGSDGKAVVHEPQTGKQLAVIDIEDNLAAAPAIAGGVAVMASESGKLSLWK